MQGNPYRGEIAFPLFDGTPGFEFAREGTVLRFRSGDLVQLRQKHGENYKAKVVFGLNECDPNVVLDCLVHGLKGSDGKRLVLAKDVQDDLPFALDPAAVLIYRALFWAWYGRTPEEAAEEARKVMEATLDQAEVEGLRPPEMSSSSSSTRPLEPEKDQTLSGN